jgi:hypothetical protein
MLEETVLVGHLNQLEIAKAALVGNEGKVRVVVLVAVFTKYLGVVESVVEEELLGIIVGINVDLTESIVSSELNVAFGNSGLQPRKEELQAVALLDGLDERFDRVKVVHVCDEVAHVVSGASQVKQGADYGGSSDRIAAYVCLDVSRVVILVEVDDEVGYKVVTVANNDEGPLISELGLLEEVASANGVVVVGVTTRALNFPEPSHVSSSLDVLEVDLWTLGVGVHLSVEGLEEADQSVHGELNDEFDRNGHHDWQVLEDVDDEHVVEDIEAVFSNGDLTKEVHEEQLIDGAGIRDHDALDVGEFGVVFQSALEEPSLLAH